MHIRLELLSESLKLNYVALVRKRNITAKRPPLVGEVSANFLQTEDFWWSAQRVSTVVNLDFLDPEQPLFRSSSSSVILTRLSEPRSIPTICQKIR
jgi:hypothetical protein